MFCASQCSYCIRPPVARVIVIMTFQPPNEIESIPYRCIAPRQSEQKVALLSQRGRAMLRVIEYFAKSLKIVRNDTV